MMETQGLPLGLQTLTFQIRGFHLWGQWVTCVCLDYPEVTGQRFDCTFLRDLGIPTNPGTEFWICGDVMSWGDRSGMTLRDHPETMAGFIRSVEMEEE